MDMDIREIARRAKVSTATVSRAINRIPTVDPQLAKRVWKVVDELGYYPNTQARALVSGKSRIFGLVVSEITNPFFPEIVQTFENLAVQHNYEILLTSTIHDPKRMESSVRRMIERRVDGVAILTFGMEDSLIEHLRFRKVPLVFVDVGPDVPGVSNILDEIGLPVAPEQIVVGDHTMEGGMRALDLISIHDCPTAVLCSNDMTAIGLMREAYDQGINIPHDLSVVGFDDIRLSEFMIPPLTTVQMSQTELAQIAFRALMNEVNGESPAQGKSEYELNTHLVLRRSTALAPAHDGRVKPLRLSGAARKSSSPHPAGTKPVP